MCIEVCPSNATNAQLILTLVASVEAPYLVLHSPLLAFKAVLSSWSLVAICALIATGVTGITGLYYLVPNCLCTIYVRVYRFCRGMGMNAYVPFVTYVRRTWEHIYAYVAFVTYV